MLPRGMATRFSGSTALFGALLGVVLLLLLAPARARAEDWQVVLARRVIGMGMMSVELVPKPTRVRIGVLFDPRRSDDREEVELQLGAFKSMAPGMSGTIDFDFEAVPVDVEAPLAAAFATRGFRIVVLPETLGDVEWTRVLALAEQHHVGTVAAIPRWLRSPSELRRMGPAAFVFPSHGGAMGMYADLGRANREGVFNSRVFGLSTTTIKRDDPPAPSVAPAPPAPPAPPVPPAPPAPPAPSAPASGVAP